MRTWFDNLEDAIDRIKLREERYAYLRKNIAELEAKERDLKQNKEVKK